MYAHKCPTCSSPLSVVDLPRIGELVYCQNCETTYEVVWLFPLEMIPVSESKPQIEKFSD